MSDERVCRSSAAVVQPRPERQNPRYSPIFPPILSGQQSAVEAQEVVKYTSAYPYPAINPTYSIRSVIRNTSCKVFPPSDHSQSASLPSCNPTVRSDILQTHNSATQYTRISESVCHREKGVRNRNAITSTRILNSYSNVVDMCISAQR